jgi:hypothetical protein
MNKFIHTRFSIVVLIFLVIYSCAKIGSPSGGPRDREPPFVIESTPAAGSKNFSGYKIEITLNEYIALDNINENLLVSPPMKKKPKVWIKSKSIIAEFEEDLKDSTTYLLNFQNAIKDLNEGNVLENYRFVFSTGPVLDSLSVTGNVYNADNLEAPEKVFVLMYRELADSAVKKHLPYYLTLADRHGYFRIDNISPGFYRLYALKDADNNKMYNLKDEAFAFLDAPIEVTADSNWLPIIKDTATVKKPPVVKKDLKKNLKDKLLDTIAMTGKNKLMLFTAAPTARYLVSSERKLKYQLEFALSLPPDSMDFDFTIPDAAPGSFLAEKSIQKDTMIVWLNDTSLYNQNQITTYLKYPFTDTTGMVGYKLDTVKLRYIPPKTLKSAPVKKRGPMTVTNNTTAGLIKPGKELVFISETPLKDPDTSMINLYDITKKDTLVVPYLFLKDSLTARKFVLKAKILPDKKYFFVADSGTFRNYYDECSDSIGLKFSQKPADAYSKLTFNLKNGEGKMIIQLLDKSEKLVAETVRKGDGKAEFPLLEPGTYRARVIFDSDGNNKWTTGDFSKKRLPEAVTYYPKELEVKAKFELEQDWDVGLKYEKDQKLRSVKSN